jgi:hypothetical protein
VQAKAGAGSATTCMAYAGYRYGRLAAPIFKIENANRIDL